MFDKYTVFENANKQRRYFYGPLSDYTEEDFEEYSRPVSQEAYSCEDLVILFGCVLEDNNYHNLTSLGEEILNALNAVQMSEKDKTMILRNFMENFLKQRNIK